MPALFAVLGLVAGVLVEGIVSSFHHDGTLWPWPRCRECGLVAPPSVLTPLLGYLRLARCAGCGRAQAARALQIEVATALVFYVLGTRYTGYPLPLVLGLVEAALLVAILFIDLELRLIPTLLVALLVVLGLGGAGVWPGLGLMSAVQGGALGFGSFGLLVLLARVVFGEGALGMGDANLALAIGCLTGFPLVVLALSLGVFLGGVGAVAVLIAGVVTHGKRGGLRSTIPYGPFLVLGVLYILAHGNTLDPLITL